MKARNYHSPAACLLFLLVAWTPPGNAQTPSPSKITYLSDLVPSGTPVNGYGPYEKDKSNGEDKAGDGSPLQMGRVPYTKGLGVHAASELTFALDKQYATFSAAVGIDDEVLANGCAPNLLGSVVFQVFVDDMKMYDSGKVTVQSSALDVTVDVTGKTTLRLVVGGAGDDLLCDHADWADAKLTAAAGGSLARKNLDVGESESAFDARIGDGLNALPVEAPFIHVLAGLDQFHAGSGEELLKSGIRKRPRHSGGE